MCDTIYEETSGCISIKVGGTLPGTIYTEPINQISVDVVCVCAPSTLIVESTYQASFECSLVCTVDIGPLYLRVTPEEPIWISMDVSGDYYVESNTNWAVS